MIRFIQRLFRECWLMYHRYQCAKLCAELEKLFNKTDQFERFCFVQSQFEYHIEIVTRCDPIVQFHIITNTGVDHADSTDRSQ